MKNGTIFLWPYEKSDKPFWNFVGKAISFFSGYPYTHDAILVDGNVYEYSVWTQDGKWKTGLRVTPIEEFEKVRYGYEIWKPTFTLTKKESSMMVYYAETFLAPHRYNVLKLLSLAVVYPLRGIFKKLKWVPFDSFLFGDVCSMVPDEMMMYAGIDLFPDDIGGYIVPGMYTECQYYIFDKKRTN